MAPRLRTAVIPVAGRGTRFLPVTKAVPKELLPIGDRPCIEYIVAEAVEAGLDRIVFVTARGKGALMDYFDRSPDLEAALEAAGKADYLTEVRRVAAMAEVVGVRQQETKGLGHAVLCARPAVGDQPFAVCLGDDIVDSATPAIAQLRDTWAAAGGDSAVLALMEVPREDTRKYGVCGGTWSSDVVMKVSEMVEKPEPENAPSHHAIVGRYILPADIFDILETTPRGRGDEIQLTDAIAVLANQGRVLGRVFEGERFDTGNPLGLLRASLHFMAKRPELADGVARIIAEHQERQGR